MERSSARYFLLCLIGFFCFGCSWLGIGGHKDKPKTRVSLAFALPDELKSVSETDLFASLTIYDNKKDFELVQESDLVVADGLVHFEEFQKTGLLKAAGDTSSPTGSPDTSGTFQAPAKEIVLLRKRDYTFVVLFQVHVGNGVLLPVAYIQKTVSFANSSDLLSFVHGDYTFGNSSGILNDLSADFNVNGITLPNLDLDGDASSNLSEYLDNTDPENATIYPTPDAPRCGNGILNADEQCDDGNTDDSDTCNALCQKAPPVITVISPTEGQTVKDTMIILGEAASEWGVRSLTLTEPSGIEDQDFSSETSQGVWDTTNLPEDEEETLVFLASDEEGRERTKTVTVKVDNAPNITSFGPGATINRGSSLALSWNVGNFSTLSIDNLDAGERKLFTATGSTIVAPTSTTTYTLTATRTNPQGQTFTSQSQATVTVNAQPSVPVISTTPGLKNETDTSFTWSASAAGSSNCATLTYNLIVKKPDTGSVRGETVFTSEGISGTSFNTATLSSRLEPRSNYEVQLTARNSCGLSASTSFTPFSTLDSGLVGWWRFEASGDLGLNTADSSHHHGIVTDNFNGNGVGLPVQTGGVTADSLAMSLAGFDPYLDLGDADGLANLKDALTVELWIKPSEEKDAYVISHGDLTDGWMVMQEDKNLRVRVTNGTDITDTTVVDAFAVDGWNFVAFSYDGKRIRTYVNGFLRENPKLTGSIDYGAVGLFKKTLIGTSKAELGVLPPANKFFKGAVDEVAVYSRALSSSEVRANCRRNDPGSVCAELGVPEPVFPLNNLTLPPNKAFISWQQVDQPANKTIKDYTLCYVPDGDISGAYDCQNTTITTVTRHVIDYMPLLNSKSLLPSKSYSWKVYTNYTDRTQSTASKVWNFTTDNSLTKNWDFDSEGGTRSLTGSSSETISNILSLGAHSAVSIEARARVHDAATSIIPSAIVSGGGATGWRMQMAGVPGQILCLLPTDDPGDAIFVSSFGFITDSFNHVVCSYDQVSQSKRIHMNTDFNDNLSRDTDEASATGEINYDSTNVTIGDDPNAISGTLTPFSGLIDEVAIYDKALSTDEVLNNFCALETLAGSPLPSVCQ